MLEIYENINEFEKFSQNVVYREYNKEKTYNEILQNDDILILNEEKYTIDDIEVFLQFQKYRPSIESRKITIINNFDTINIKLQNKLLKTYEESEHLHIIIIKNQRSVLPTILSRGIIKSYTEDEQKIEKYPVRYHKIINTLLPYNLEDLEIEKYLKFYDYLKKEDYKTAYMYITSMFIDYNEMIIYEIFQSTPNSKIKLSNLLMLQEKLFSNAHKKLQIENFLLNLTT